MSLPLNAARLTRPASVSTTGAGARKVCFWLLGKGRSSRGRLRAVLEAGQDPPLLLIPKISFLLSASSNASDPLPDRGHGCSLLPHWSPLSHSDGASDSSPKSCFLFCHGECFLNLTSYWPRDLLTSSFPSGPPPDPLLPPLCCFLHSGLLASLSLGPIRVALHFAH